jgi:hypothetical protein
MWLILWTFIAILPIGVVLFFAIKGLYLLRPATRRALRSVQAGAQQVSDVTGRVSVKVAAPAIRLHAGAAQVGRLHRAIFRRKEE